MINVIPNACSYRLTIYFCRHASLQWINNGWKGVLTIFPQDIFSKNKLKKKGISLLWNSEAEKKVFKSKSQTWKFAQNKVIPLFKIIYNSKRRAIALLPLAFRRLPCQRFSFMTAQREKDTKTGAT